MPTHEALASMAQTMMRIKVADRQPTIWDCMNYAILLANHVSASPGEVVDAARELARRYAIEVA